MVIQQGFQFNGSNGLKASCRFSSSFLECTWVMARNLSTGSHLTKINLIFNWCIQITHIFSSAIDLHRIVSYLLLSFVKYFSSSKSKAPQVTKTNSHHFISTRDFIQKSPWNSNKDVSTIILPNIFVWSIDIIVYCKQWLCLYL